MKQSHSEQAEHIHHFTLTLQGTTDQDVARQIFLQLFAFDDAVRAEDILIRAGKEPGAFEADFPVCCFHRQDETYWGVCRFGVPGPCSPERPGCPA